MQAQTTLEDGDVASSVGELIGETPLLQLDAFAQNLLGKVESANPYSVKDRIAREMLDDAEAAGDLEPGGTVVASTSGNTGIGLASVAAARDYDCVLTMPASMSEERRALLSALGADLELTPADEGMGGANERAAELADEHENAILARQFENPANARAHRRTTGAEIYEKTDGAVDAVVAGVGTGGTITGVGRYLTEDADADVTMVGVEPAASPTLSERSSASHDIQGIGPGFLPDVLDTDVVDEVRGVGNEEAKEAARRVAREEGLLVGISAGAAVAAAAEYAREHPEEVTVAVLPDGGERYLSTDLYEA
ncbi:cysteine synthase [Halobacterium hubeiense]|jgi:cysteine synthase A|uniref:Cysteine synthase n=1 Tax=Halobacterium hubeiense TaxID=1407499 RepID=A0A0U5H6L8_9EURY|nr:cysteine synthase A [Halobacterium hubeiense]CQH62240.1 cysteine synthase [Halobacterium hubeiense]